MLQNHEIAVVDVKLRLCMWLRVREDFRLRRIPRDDNWQSYVDRTCCWEEMSVEESGLAVSGKNEIVK